MPVKVTAAPALAGKASTANTATVAVWIRFIIKPRMTNRIERGSTLALQGRRADYCKSK